MVEEWFKMNSARSLSWSILGISADVIMGEVIIVALVIILVSWSA